MKYCSRKEFQGNKTGLLLMELRSKFAALSPTQNRIPLVSPLLTSMELRTLLSAHIICFTAESVFHFLYPAQIRLPNSPETLPSPAHYIAKQAIRYRGSHYNFSVFTSLLIVINYYKSQKKL